MFKKAASHHFVILAMAALCGSSLSQSAAACDHGKILQSAREGVVKTMPRLQAGALMRSLDGSQSQAGAAPGITGLWDVTDTYQGQVVDEYFDTWISDGNEFFIDATNPAADNVCQGTWIPFSPDSSTHKDGSLTYKLKHVSWTFDSSGNLNGSAVFHDTIELSSDAQSFTGVENVYLYDLDGNLIDEFLGDSLKGTRIHADF